MKEVQTLLHQVGGWGSFQKRFCLIVAIAEISSGYLTMLISITSETLKHRCFVPEVDGVTGEKVLNSSLNSYIPFHSSNSTRDFEECLQYNYTQFSNATFKNSTISPCQSGWVYDNLYKGKTSVVSEFNLVCERSWMKPASSSTFMAGILCGSLTTGYFADRFGRQLVLKIAIIGRFFLAIITSFSPNFIFYSICSFILGFGVLAFSIPISVLAQEVCAPNMRFFITMVLMSMFGVGYTLVPLVSFYVRDWRWFLRVLGFSGVIYIPYLWILPKSPFWLLNKMKYKEASKVLTKISKCNGTYNEKVKNILSESNLKVMAEQSHNNTQANQTNTSYLDLFKSKTLAIRITCVSFLWFQVASAYYTLALNSVQMAGSPYLNNFLIGLCDIFGNFIVLPMSQVIGRVPTNIACFATGSIASFLIAVFDSSHPQVTVYIAMVAKIAASGIFGLIYLYTVEIFPTPMRNKAVGFCSAIGRVGSILSPYVIYLGTSVGEWLTYVILGSIGVVAVLLSASLPESLNKTLPETTQQAKSLKGLHSRRRVNVDGNFAGFLDTS